ncbi:aminotransferase class IV [Archangium gephyra]|nr:aminotransferase class IV [Archangium gephyra]
MMVMGGCGAREADCLRLDFKGSFDPQAARESELEAFLQVLEAYAGEWMPDTVKGKRQRKYTRAAVLRALEERGNERYTHCGLSHAQWPEVDMLLGLYLPPLLPMLDIVIKVKELFFFAKEDRCRHFVEMVRAWACRYPATHARAHSADDAELAGSPRFGRDEKTSRRDGFDKIYEVCWLNVFGPQLVETVGRERMLSTPAHRVEELPNGSVLLVTWPIAADFASKEARLAQARAHAHLRPDLDFDTILRSLHERSARFAPVKPCFHPDLAPLLSRVVDRAASHERQRRIAEFNAWQPPEPEEWRPAGSALPLDVDSPERSLEYYSTLAEHLVALLHSQVPSVFEATPESLTDADFYFWREEFPKSRLREAIDEHAVPAIGAYLGEVLVRNLGGKWIPRQKLEEAQVLVGNRVWLPFVRARHYMRSRQALLDYSLTQFFRVAERHQG